VLLVRLGEVADRIRHAARRRRWSPTEATGRRGEDLAHRYLQRKGYTIIGRNYRTRSGSGEIDIIARDGDTLVFVEVKTRTTAADAEPERAMGERKEAALIRGARDYCRRTNADPALVRFDVVGVVLGESARIRHAKNALALPL
jgi:putative endonuclease